MKTKIFAAFPETGKTYATRMHHDKVKELNSRYYYFTEDHEYFFNEKYTRDLVTMMGFYDIILVDTSLNILSILVKEKFDFKVILPDEELIKQLMTGHNEYEKQLMNKHLTQLEEIIKPENKIYLHRGESVNIYLEKHDLV